MAMKFASLASICALLLIFPLSARADDRVDRLSEEHRDWLERDVTYIITDREREVFLSLETIEERDRFIEAFWRKRDPNPATPVNEYKEEHYRRLDHANTYLGRDTFRQGWQTDRGRYYILLGEPRETQRYVGYNQLVSVELWFYQGDPALGTPAFFYLLFYKRNDIGEYRLYHPVVDGPQALLTGSQFLSGTNNMEAVNALREISPELAAASLSFDTSEPPDLVSGRPALGTDIMIARIEESPKRAIRTDYADAWLRYGSRVSAEYSFNFVPSRSIFSMLAEPRGTVLVQFSIEIDPENFTLETDEDRTKYYTTLDVTVEARTPDGTLVVASDKEVYLELTPSQVQQVQAHPFAYQDDFPLVPGEYTVTVIVRNRVIKQYTVAEETLTIPDLSRSGPTLTAVIPAFDTSSTGGADASGGNIRTYQVGDLRIQPAAGNVFVIGDTIHLVAQAYGASADHKVMFELESAGDVVKSLESPVEEPSGLVVDHLSLDDMVGGNYELRARLVSPGGETVSSKAVPITVSPRSAAVRPSFIYRRGFNTTVPGLLSFVLGDQLWSLGRFEEAKAALEEAVASGNPQLPAARWKLANAYLREERAEEALELLRPLEEAFSEQFEVVAGLGFGFYLKGDYEKAVSYLARAKDIRPPDTLLWNALGDSYQRLGDRERAKEAFERSLELDQEQPSVQERLRALEASDEKSPPQPK